MVVPQITSAFSSTASLIKFMASITSASGDSVCILKCTKTPIAPLIVTLSSSGDWIAFFTASCAASSPSASPAPIRAIPRCSITFLTSAKSEFISLFPEPNTIALIPLTARARTLSTILKLSFIPALLSIKAHSLSLGITTIESLSFLSSLNPISANWRRFLPSKEKGIVTTETVNAPTSLATCAITGAAPVPVPPPKPEAINTISEYSKALFISSRLSSAALQPTSGTMPAPKPLVIFSPS